MSTKIRLQLGDWIEFDDERHQITGFTGTGTRLLSETGAPQIALTSALIADPSFRSETAPPERSPIQDTALDPGAQLETIPQAERTRVLDLEAHILEATTGYRSGDSLHPAPGEPRPEYHPDLNLEARITTKAEELDIQPRSMWRLIHEWRDRGLWGLVDKRKARLRNPLRSIDPRVIQAIRDQARAENLGSSTTITGAFMRRTRNRLEEEYGPDTVAFPKKDAFRRAVTALLEHRPSDPAYRRASRANQPDRVFGTLAASRPGEVVMLDSTPLDVLAYDPVTDSTGRIELTLALDLATRSILAWRMTPESTKSIDIGLVLADVMTPEPMRPAWNDALRYAQLRIPYERILEIDQRFEHAAARPVIYPETLLFDHGKPYQSEVVTRFARKHRIDIQDARKLKPTDKPQIERLFKTVNSQFAEHMAGYKGFNVAHRGQHVEAQAKWTIDELEELFAEYVVAVYQRRTHDGLFLHGFPNLTLSPNGAYAQAMSSAGFVECPADPEMYFELLPIEMRQIHPYGVEIDYLHYNAEILYTYRKAKSPYPSGAWPIRRDPRNPLHAYFRDPADGRWHVLRWTRALDEHEPFTDITLREAKRLVAARGHAPKDQEAIAQALIDLQNRGDDPSAWTKTDRKRWRRDAHRAAAQKADLARATPPITALPLPEQTETDKTFDPTAVPAADVWDPYLEDDDQ